MKRIRCGYALALGLVTWMTVACSKPAATHNLQAPPPPLPVVKAGTPLTKEEKIARINASSLPAERKKAEIDKVNAESN